jgi:3D (Asp-Asp-Asp) domain-containing protein
MIAYGLTTGAASNGVAGAQAPVPGVAPLAIVSSLHVAGKVQAALARASLTHVTISASGARGAHVAAKSPVASRIVTVAASSHTRVTAKRSAATAISQQVARAVLSGVKAVASSAQSQTAWNPARMPGGNAQEYFITGYTATGNLTATGTVPHWGTVAVDSSVIPLGSTVYIQGLGAFHAEDTGSYIVGDHVDVFVNSVAAAYKLTGYRLVSFTPPKH